MRKIAYLFLIGMILLGSASAQQIKEVSSREAYHMVTEAGALLIDVRTIAEYVYVGHPDMARCLPVDLWDEQSMRQASNPCFIEELKARFQPGDTLIFICRSGNRSLHAAEMAIHAGFTRSYNIRDGFEGKKDAEGHRTVEGWKCAGLPYTYKIDPALICRRKERSP